MREINYLGFMFSMPFLYSQIKMKRTVGASCSRKEHRKMILLSLFFIISLLSHPLMMTQKTK